MVLLCVDLLCHLQSTMTAENNVLRSVFLSFICYLFILVSRAIYSGKNKILKYDKT